VTILNPDHLFEQAAMLAAPRQAGPPRQADLRRAISAVYYGIFHFALGAVADEFVGVTQRASGRYALVYRSIDHRTLKDICNEVRKQKLSSKFARHIPPTGVDPDIQAFATAAFELQEKRHAADYDPQPRYERRDAMLAIEAAQSAVRAFRRAGQDDRRTFLTLLLCPPR
jgi:hypothetical protein